MKQHTLVIDEDCFDSLYSQLRKNNFLKGLSGFVKGDIHSMSCLFPFQISNYLSLTPFLSHVFGNDSSFENFKDSRTFKLILWSIIGGTRGGPNRARILNLLMMEQFNSYQISKKLNLDHKTIRHHLKILTKNSLIVKSAESYGATFTLTPIMKQNVGILKEIVEKMRRTD